MKRKLILKRKKAARLKRIRATKILILVCAGAALTGLYKSRNSVEENYLYSNYKAPKINVSENLSEKINEEVINEYIEDTKRKIRKTNIKLVNKENGVSSSYVPENLVIVNVKSQKQIKLEKTTCEMLEELFKQASNEGMDLYLVSGYRSYYEQSVIYNNSLLRRGKSHTDSYVSMPGHSEHQLGLAADVTSVNHKDLLESFENTKEGKWLKENAYKFGFIIRYQKGKENITKYGYEPWHIRYVGKDYAEEITKNGLVLEEYLES